MVALKSSTFRLLHNIHNQTSCRWFKVCVSSGIFDDSKRRKQKESFSIFTSFIDPSSLGFWYHFNYVMEILAMNEPQVSTDLSIAVE